MTSSDVSGIEAITYIGGCGSNRVSHHELLQQRQQQSPTAQQPFHVISSPTICEHECTCMHHHAPYHGNNLSSSNVALNEPFVSHHSHFGHLSQHVHSSGSYKGGHHQHPDGSSLIYNSSTNSECNQPVRASTSENSHSGCNNGNLIHFVPGSNAKSNNLAPQALNIVANASCECTGHLRHRHHHHHHQQQQQQQQQQQSGQNSRNVSCDENPSGTEDGESGVSSSEMISACTISKQHLNILDGSHHAQRLRSPKCSEVPDNDDKRNQDDAKYSNALERVDAYSSSSNNNENAIKDDANEGDRPPRLPPRPPPRLRNTIKNEIVPHPHAGVRKYVIWCLICGGILILLGIMFLAVYFLLRSYTSTVGYFETVPPFVPATLLLLTGLCIMSLARRRNRYSYLIKLSGACSLASALTCALVTVTTTVIHMSRLQALKECQYTQKTRTCTCSSTLSESDDDDDSGSVRFVFDATTDCGVVHGALYSCLRAVFGLSVAGVFVAVFSCMLVYQLLSHERKKMYWEQLELRCRSLYSGPALPPGPAIIGTQRGVGSGGACRCCEQCHAHRATISTAYSWDGDNSHFWAGQAGNFYSPNPGDEGTRMSTTADSSQRNRSWAWPRMPWQRNIESNAMQGAAQTQLPPPPPPGQRFLQPISSSDSQYGFSNGPATDNSSVSQQNGYTVIAPYSVWGPPPPYSDPNSPARRGRYQYIHTNACHQGVIEQHISSNLPIIDCHQQHNSSSIENHSGQFCTDQNYRHQQQPPPSSQQQQQQQQHHLQQQHQQQRNVIKRPTQFKSKENYENTQSDSDVGVDSRCMNNAARKIKKRTDIVAASPQQPQQRASVQNVLKTLHNHSEVSENEYHEPQHPGIDCSSKTSTPQHVIKCNNGNASNNGKSGSGSGSNSCKVKLGIENTGFQSVDAIEHEQGELNGESEVYFADVSSCCNVSVKNDNYYDDTKDTRRASAKGEKADADEYLSQRFGNREPSTRSRLPFPQMATENYEKSAQQPPAIPAPRTSIMQKEISHQSMCSSVDSSEKTDFTDLSPSTPTNGVFQRFTKQQDDFVATFPYNEPSQEAHRRSTKNLHQDISIAAPANDSPYETIREDDLIPASSISTSSGSNSSSSSNNNKSSPTHSYLHKNPTTKTFAKDIGNALSSPATATMVPIQRQNLGTNISAIIQNLSGNDISLLYPENTNSSLPSLHRKQTQDCNDVNSSIVNSEWSEMNGNQRL